MPTQVETLGYCQVSLRDKDEILVALGWKACETAGKNAGFPARSKPGMDHGVDPILRGVRSWRQQQPLLGLLGDRAAGNHTGARGTTG